MLSTTTASYRTSSITLTSAIRYAKSAQFLVNPAAFSMLCLGLGVTNPALAQSAISTNLAEAQQVQVMGQKTKVATKTDTRVEDITQAIQVIDVSDALDKGSTALQETLRYSAAVTAEPYGPDSRYDNIFVRGLEAVQTLDGVRKIFTFSPVPRIDLMAIERVEVLKGPASVVYGQANSGGVVNAVSKLPKFKNELLLQGQLGNNSRRQVSLDGQFVDGNKLWAMRVVGLVRDAGTFVGPIKDDRVLLMPSAVFKPVDGTQLSVQLLYQKDKGASTQQFLPIAAVMPHLFGDKRKPIASHTFVGDANFDKLVAEQKMLTLAWQQNLGQDWELNAQYRNTRSNTELAMIYPENYSNPENPFIEPGKRLVNRLYYAVKPDMQLGSADINVFGKINTAGLQHQILFGVDRHRYTENNQMGYGATTPIDLDNPVSHGVQAAVYAPQPKQTSLQTGWYLQDQIQFGAQWLAMMGLRSDKSATTNEGSAENSVSSVSKRLGLMYRADAGIHPYFNYSESFMPVLGLNFYGKSFVPIKGKQIEAGAKFLFDKTAYLNVAAFKINEKNRQANDPDNPNNVVQVGEISSKGLELEFAGKLSAATFVQANASLIDATTIRSTIVQDVGKRLVDVPRVQANLWLGHKLNLNQQKWDAGIGVRYVGETHSHNSSRTFVTPAYTLFDVRAGVQLEQVNLSLVVTNLANKEHFLACRAIGDCFAGTGRQILLNSQFKF